MRTPDEVSESHTDSPGQSQSVAPAQLKMPPALIERARALVGVVGATSTLPDGWTPPVPRDAATVVLVHDTEQGIEVFVQRRVRTMSFAAGMYVFPGGAVEPGDRQAAKHLADEHRANTVLAGTVAPSPLIVIDGEVGTDTLAARVAAVRETAEEAGFRLRDPQDLRYIAHWITPEVEERRFDTRFYAVAISQSTGLVDTGLVDTGLVDTVGLVDTAGESDHSLWIRPADALEQYAAREMAMLPPTVAVLSEFAGAAADGCNAQQCVDVLGAMTVTPLLPSPVADSTATHGVSWVLLDVRTGRVVTNINGAPAGSEALGVTQSLGSAQLRGMTQAHGLQT